MLSSKAQIIKVNVTVHSFWCKAREDIGFKTYCVVFHADRKTSNLSPFFASKLPFSDSDEVWSVWNKGYLRAKGKAKKTE